MLTQDDLKAIKGIITDEVAPLQKNIELLQKTVAPLQKNIELLQKDIKVIKKDNAETRNDVKVLISYFDREYVSLRKRIEAIEEHLDLPTVH